ncbi:ABC transporter substrate-binding protein [Pseudonocardia acaciae]|uniref:ABC transporter substrate-binding protein n=1 Tax=Pseudonocardia acaciae TaxID=551276 RepID=UPI00048AE7F4|nr:ABC transporter substrate-binding protein [Pseudonocardia acaciae]
MTRRSLTALVLSGVLAGVTACAAPQAAPPTTGNTVTITNCGAPAQFPSPARRMFVNDGNMISLALALGAADQVAAISSLEADAPMLRRHYGDALDRLHIAAPRQPARETVLARHPDVMLAGWSYGYAEATGLTPDTLRAAGIAPYILTESCRQRAGEKARGTVEPWTAVREDLTNVGAITGRQARAAELVADIDRRRDALAKAPAPPRPITVFLFDSATDTVFTSGRFGGPEAIITAAGARNAAGDVSDTWTRVSWERVVASKPDAFAFVDYPSQTFADKVALLRARPGVAELPAVAQGRFLNLPYSMWTSGPLNIDAAETLRQSLEGWGLAPPSGIRPPIDDRLD